MDGIYMKEYYAARRILYYSALLSSTFWSMLIILEFLSIVDFIKGKGWHHFKAFPVEIKLHVMLAVQSITVIAPAIAIMYIESAEPYAFSSPQCASLGKFMASSYMISMQSTYYIFLIKASMVEGYNQSKTFKTVAVAVRIIIAVFVPFVGIPLVIAFWGGTVLPDGHCVMTTEANWIPIFFFVGNFTLSLLLLFLFVQPLKMSAKSLNDIKNPKGVLLKKIMWRNIKYSMIAIAFDLLMQIGLAIIEFNLQFQPNMYHLHVWFLFCPFINLSLNAMCTRAMTSLWLPNALRPFIRGLEFQMKREHANNQSDESNDGDEDEYSTSILVQERSKNQEAATVAISPIPMQIVQR